ncbi:MAG TPA: Uma2 family endonuclease [Chloroflexota bacterium]|nr:Uma2 family endonuclease [Chloroflexota bacterium]
MAVAVQRETRRFTVDDYHRMGETGILRAGERVELIEGEILKMTPIGTAHLMHVLRLSDQLNGNYRDVTLVEVQNPVRLSDNTEPEPDIVLLTRRDDYYGKGIPGPSDVLLLIEVSDSSLSYDRNVKVPIYARAGIPEVWLLDVEAKVLTSYRDPSPSGYQVTLDFRHGDVIAPIAFPDRPIALADLIG